MKAKRCGGTGKCLAPQVTFLASALYNFCRKSRFLRRNQNEPCPFRRAFRRLDEIHFAPKQPWFLFRRQRTNKRSGFPWVSWFLMIPRRKYRNKRCGFKLVLTMVSRWRERILSVRRKPRQPLMPQRRRRYAQRSKGACTAAHSSSGPFRKPSARTSRTSEMCGFRGFRGFP